MRYYRFNRVSPLAYAFTTTPDPSQLPTGFTDWQDGGAVSEEELERTLQELNPEVRRKARENLQRDGHCVIPITLVQNPRGPA